ncbi:efflux RND transporter periplasmic adaptor subunit [bacterium]|nr:efflux RND transporter periplasmic adaptor subunit [bacterium]
MPQTVTVESITRRRKRFRLRGWLVWPIVLLLGLAGGAYWLQGRTAARAMVHYTTAAAKVADITVVVTAVGSVQPIQQVDVGSLISGTISEIDVKINDAVTKGQVLARLDTSSLEAELARDQATLSARRAEVQDALAAQEAAAETLDRAQKIRDKGLNSLEDLAAAITAKRRADAALASARANVQVAEADVKLSQTNIDKAVIVAPIDGMVLDLQADLGQTVSVANSTVTLFTLAHDLGQMELQVDVDEADIGKVAVGDKASFSVDAYLGQTFPASVSEMHYAPQTVDNIVTYPTILAIDNSDHRLRPGMTASADITVEEAKGVLSVPNAALRYSPPQVAASPQKTTGLLGMLFSSVPTGPRPTTEAGAADKDGFRSLYIMKDGQPVRIAVKTGVTDGDVTQVLDGPLQPGDLVVTAQTTGAP